MVRHMKRSFVFLLCLLPSFVLQADVLEDLHTFIQEAEQKGTIDTSDPGWRTNLPKFPQVAFAETERYEWVLETTEGTLTATLNHQAAPDHVRNIAYLSLLGFYDGLVFHRIIPGFMAQGGCPEGTGRGGPGYNVSLEVTPQVTHDRPGILSMARSRHPDSAGSQFFITFKPTPFLDRQYSVFGVVKDGLDVLKKLEAAGNSTPGANGTPPLKTIRILSATVRPVLPDQAP